jgi:hypothetical protein
MATGGLLFPVSTQRHQALFGLGALFALVMQRRRFTEAIPLDQRLEQTPPVGRGEVQENGTPLRCRYRTSEGVIVAPALKTASCVIAPCECTSGSFAKAITTQTIVPNSAVIAVIAAGRNLSDRSFFMSDIP